MNNILYKVNIATSPETSDLLLETAAVWNISPAVWQDEDRNVALVDTFFKSEAAAGIFAARAKDWLKNNATDEHYAVTINSIVDEDWAESWKQSFRAERVSPRVIIKPSWETCEPGADDCVIEIDPGMSFGTGSHGTTRACIQFLDKLSALYPGHSVLDIGCGSGILSIAAAMLGFAPVTGFDNDSDAIRIASENAQRNRVDNLTSFYVGDLQDVDSSKRYDIVVANILANVIRENARNIAARVSCRESGYLIISGILENQYDDVLQAFIALGFKEQKAVIIEEWKSGLLSAEGGKDDR